MQPDNADDVSPGQAITPSPNDLKDIAENASSLSEIVHLDSICKATRHELEAALEGLKQFHHSKSTTGAAETQFLEDYEIILGWAAMPEEEGLPFRYAALDYRSSLARIFAGHNVGHPSNPVDWAPVVRLINAGQWGEARSEFSLIRRLMGDIEGIKRLALSDFSNLEVEYLRALARVHPKRLTMKQVARACGIKNEAQGNFRGVSQGLKDDGIIQNFRPREQIRNTHIYLLDLLL